MKFFRDTGAEASASSDNCRTRIAAPGATKSMAKKKRKSLSSSALAVSLYSRGPFFQCRLIALLSKGTTGSAS